MSQYSKSLLKETNFSNSLPIKIFVEETENNCNQICHFRWEISLIQLLLIQWFVFLSDTILWNIVVSANRYIYSQLQVINYMSLIALPLLEWQQYTCQIPRKMEAEKIFFWTSVLKSHNMTWQKTASIIRNKLCKIWLVQIQLRLLLSDSYYHLTAVC